MAAYEKAHIDEIASNQWPHWIPVRHHFGIETFGINLWRGQDDGTVIPEHDESASSAPELYYVVEGQATFTVDGDEVDAPAGTCVWVTDPETKQLLPKEACVRFFKKCLADGLIAMSYSPRVRIHPPLVLTAEEATRALAIFDAALGRLDAELSA